MKIATWNVNSVRARMAQTLARHSDSPEALEGMKFSDCLPPTLAVQVLGMRSQDRGTVEHVLRTPVRMVSG